MSFHVEVSARSIDGVAIERQRKDSKMVDSEDIINPLSRADGLFPGYQ
jgi:hypothetical protein